MLSRSVQDMWCEFLKPSPYACKAGIKLEPLGGPSQGQLTPVEIWGRPVGPSRPEQGYGPILGTSTDICDAERWLHGAVLPIEASFTQHDLHLHTI
jgi:hypothetical protein